MEKEIIVEYYITAVWFENFESREHITHVLFHHVGPKTVFAGQKKAKEEILKYVKAKQVYTAMWNYETHNWMRKALVTLETLDGIVYLRSQPDNSTEDNLKHLLSGHIIHKCK